MILSSLPCQGVETRPGELSPSKKAITKSCFLVFDFPKNNEKSLKRRRLQRGFIWPSYNFLLVHKLNEVNTANLNLICSEIVQ